MKALSVAIKIDDRELSQRIKNFTDKFPSVIDRGIMASAIYGGGLLKRSTPISRAQAGQIRQLTAPGLTKSGWLYPVKKSDRIWGIKHSRGTVIKVLDMGAKPHAITPKRKKALYFQHPIIRKIFENKFKKLKKPFVLIKTVSHPGQRAQRIVQDNLPKIKDFFAMKMKEICARLLEGKS